MRLSSAQTLFCKFNPASSIIDRHEGYRGYGQAKTKFGSSYFNNSLMYASSWALARSVVSPKT